MEIAKAYGNSVTISPKYARVISDAIRKKKVSRAKAILIDSIEMRRAIPFNKHTNGLGHKPGMSAGRYIPTACKEVLILLKSAEANAKNKGMNTDILVVSKIFASNAAAQWHYGRQGSRKMKRTNIVLELSEEKAEPKKEKKSKPKQEVKA